MYGDGVHGNVKLFGVAEFAKAMAVKRLGVHITMCALSVALGVIVLSVSVSILMSLSTFSMTSLRVEVGGVPTVKSSFGDLLALGDTHDSRSAFGVTVAGVLAVAVAVVAVSAFSVDLGVPPPFSINWTLAMACITFVSTQ